LGGTEEVQADIRVIAATNQDLQKMVAEGRFREDLYYRINVIQVQLPPLRDRREDVPLLAEHFLTKYAKAADKSVRGISHDAQELLSAYMWPGNVRELENVIERAVALEQTPLVPRAPVCLIFRKASISKRRESSSIAITSRWRSSGAEACKPRPRNC